MAALTGPDAEVEVATAEDEDEAAGLAAGLDAWRAAAQAPAGPVRTCFRLVEPVAADPDDRAPGAAASPAPARPMTRPAQPPATSPPGPPMGCGRSSSPCSRRRIPA